MALIDHFAPNAGTNAGENGFSRLPVHEFSGTLELLAAPTPVAVNKAQVIAFWLLTEEPAADADETQLNEMIAAYNALATLAEQLQYIKTIENSLHLYQTGQISQTTAKTWIGLT